MDQAQALAEYLRQTGGNMPGSGLSQMMMGRGQGPVMENNNAAPPAMPQRPNDPLAPAYQGAAEGIFGMSPPAIGYGAGRAAGSMAQDPNGENAAALAMALLPGLRGRLSAFLRGKQGGMPAADAERLRGMQEETYKRTLANEERYANGQPRPMPTVVDPSGNRVVDPSWRAAYEASGLPAYDQAQYAKRVGSQTADPLAGQSPPPQAVRPPGQTPDMQQSPPALGATGPSQQAAGIPGGTGGTDPAAVQKRAYPRLGSPEIGDIRGDYMREFRSTGIPPNPRDFNKAVQGSYDGIPNVNGRVQKTNAELTRFEKEMGRPPATDAEFEKFIFATGKPGTIPRGTLGLAGMLSASAVSGAQDEAQTEPEVHPKFKDRDTAGRFLPQN